jgi:hypothetical protein
MKKFALLAPILFTFISGRSANASTLFEFNYSANASTEIGPHISASGLLRTDDITSLFLNAIGEVNGSPITGFGGSLVNRGHVRPISISFATSLGLTIFNSESGNMVRATTLDLGGNFVSFSSGNFAAVPAVPLPPSLPLFALALFALAAYRL